LTIRYQNGEVTRTLYDGRYDVSISSQEENRASVSDLQGQQRTYHIAGNIASSLLFEPLLPVLLFSKNDKHWFQRTFRRRVARIDKLPDETIDDRERSVFVAYCRDREESKDEVFTLFIDRALNIPIKYIHQQNYWGSPTYTEATISNFTLSYQEDPSCVPDAHAAIPEGYEIIKDHEQEWPQQDLLSVGTVAPLWELSMVQGGELSLAALHGKVVLLSFWYKSFGPSLQFLQTLQKLQEKFQKQGLVVVGINFYDPCEELTAFLQERGITYPNLLGDEQVTKAYQAHTPNTFYLLDQSGKVRYVTIAQGDFPQKVLSKKIKHLLKKSR
jgi:peroxiredoxin